jgi:hypothetical protein
MFYIKRYRIVNAVDTFLREPRKGSAYGMPRRVGVDQNCGELSPVAAAKGIIMERSVDSSSQNCTKAHGLGRGFYRSSKVLSAIADNHLQFWPNEGFMQPFHGECGIARISEEFEQPRPFSRDKHELVSMLGERP